MSETLPTKLIRLAQANPHLRADLLPLIASSKADSDFYFSVVIPPAEPGEPKTKWHSTSTVTRGAFDTKAEAEKWAKKNLEGSPYTVKKYPGATPSQNKKAATVYNLNGKILTLREVLSQAIAKEVSFMGNRGTLTYHAIMADKDEDTATVFAISKAQFDNLRVPDRTTPRAKDRLADLEYNQLVKTKLRGLSDQVDFNMWVQKNKPSQEERIQWLQRRG